MALLAIPITSYRVGTHNIGPLAVELGVVAVKLALTRAEWRDPALKVAARFELSLDGGATWSPTADGRAVWPWGNWPIALTAQGGDGAETSFSVSVPEPTNPQRLVRGTVVVSGGTLRTAIAVTAF